MAIRGKSSKKEKKAPGSSYKQFDRDNKPQRKPFHFPASGGLVKRTAR